LTCIAPPKPLEYQTLTVEQIINKFQQELEADALKYVEQAKRVCEYDAVLRDSQRDLAHLTTQTQRLMLEQQQVEQTLQGIGAFQDELEQTLSSVEEQVDKLFESQSHLAPQDADVERERAYDMSKTIDNRLDQLMEQLNFTASTLSAANDKAFSGQVGQIVQILNQHQTGLSQLDLSARKMEKDIAIVSRALSS
jgi:nuclear pore complex protein Nup62